MMIIYYRHRAKYIILLYIYYIYDDNDDNDDSIEFIIHDFGKKGDCRMSFNALCLTHGLKRRFR